MMIFTKVKATTFGGGFCHTSNRSCMIGPILRGAAHKPPAEQVVSGRPPKGAWGRRLSVIQGQLEPPLVFENRRDRAQWTFSWRHHTQRLPCLRRDRRTIPRRMLEQRVIPAPATAKPYASGLIIENETSRRAGRAYSGRTARGGGFMG